MSNMSYCRFQNTLSDLRDCREALNDCCDLNDFSDEEKRAAKKLIKVCMDIVEMSEDLDDE